MKTAHNRFFQNIRHLPAIALTLAGMSAVLLGAVSVQAQSQTNYNWISASPADFSTAAGWDAGAVPGALGPGTTNVLLFTNGIECDFSSPDNYWNGQMSVAPWDGSSGSFVMNSGTLLVSNAYNYYDIIIGGRSGANGVGSAAQTPSTPNTGGGGTASITMNGGTLTASRIGSGYYHQDGVWVGFGTNTTGTFTINNGTFNALCGIEIGNYGNGIFNINGGAVIDNGWFGVGRGNGAAFGTGAFNMTAGTLYQLENGGGGTVGGSGGVCLDQGCTNAMVNISGGTLYSGDICFSGSNLTPRPADTFNLSGGTLYIGYAGIYTNSAFVVPSFNISGGTFHTVRMLLSGGKGGANGAITNILADGTNWTWGPFPWVNLTNNAFQVNGVSGPGYVTFAPEANRTITLNTPFNGVGGLVLNGPGNLALGAANTYTGGTTISQGNLMLNSGGSLADPSLNFPSGSTLIFNGGGANFTNIVTGAGNVLLNNANTTVNVGSNLRNSGLIVISNGALVVNGSILNAIAITNASSTGPLVAQGTISSPITINSNASLDLGTTIVPGTLNASNITINGTWNCKINSATTPGGGTNDLLVCTNLTLGAGSALIITPLSAPSVGTYVIAQYSGTLTGSFGTVSNATRDAMSVSYATPGEIILTVTSSSGASLTWSGLIGASDNWDVNTSSNWTNTATLALDTFRQQDAVTFGGTPGATPVTNRVNVTGLVLPSSITINGGLPYLFSGTGQIGGNTGITYNDTNTSGLYTLGSTFTGPVNINNGILQLGSGGSSWLGATNGATFVNGGTLDLNGQNVGSEPLVLQGAGAAISGTNGGAINNSSTASPGQSGGPLNVTLAGDTTLNASGNRWDIGVNTLGAGGGSFVGNGFNLTKIGNQAIWMHEVGDIGVNNIDIQQGLLGFQYNIGMGIPGGTVTVEANAILGFYQLSSNSILNKQMVLNGNATLQSGGGAGSSNNFVGPITLNGTNSIQTSIYPLYLGGAISGTGGFTLTGTGPLYLAAANSYSGPTVIGANGDLVLDPGASINNTPLILLTPGANTLLDDGTSTLTLSSGQTLQGAGTVIATNVVVGAGSTISPGTNLVYGTLLFTNNLTLSGGTNNFKISDNNNVGVDNDLLIVNGTLNLASLSTIEIVPLAALSASSPYTLIQANGGITGSVGNVKVVSPSPRYTMTAQIGSTYLGGQALQLQVSGNAASLIWTGSLTHNWDQVTSNWFNLGTGNNDTFFNGDDPIFDDSSSVTTVTVTNNVLPAGIFMSNVVNSYTFNGGGVIGGALDMEGNGSGVGGTVVLATSNAPALTSIDSEAGTLVYDLPGLTNYVVAANITDNSGGGHGTIVFGGSNTVVLEGNNANAPFGGSPGFDGTLEVTNGILQYTNVLCLGLDASQYGFPAYPPTYAPLIITNNGTLDFNGVPAGTTGQGALGGEKWIHISGSGFNGQGALIDSKPNGEPNGAFSLLYFDGNATIGSVTNIRCDQHVLAGYQQIEGNTNNLTFTGSGAFFIYQQGDGDTHLGNIDVASTIPGRLAFQGGPLSLGPNTNYLMVEPDAEVTFFSVTNEYEPLHNGIDKIMWLKGGGASVDSGGASNNYVGPIFLTGTNLFGTRSDLHLWNDIMDTNGPGGFVLGNDSVGASGGDLWLDGTNSYSGPTIVSNRTLHVGVNSSLGLSTFVEVNSGATLDLSALSAFNFGTTATNQTLIGAGTITGPTGGNIGINAGGVLAPGLPTTNGVANTNTFTLTINGSLVFNAGSTYYVGVNKTSPGAGVIASDHVIGLTSVTMGGTLVVTNYGTNFVAGDAFPLFSATTYVTNGFTTNNILPHTPGPNLAWNTSTLGADGQLRVISTVSINPNPTNIVFSVSGNQLTLSWPADHTGWELEVQTNSLSVGISTNWMPISSSTGTDSMVIPINLTNGCIFYRLVYPPQ